MRDVQDESRRVEWLHESSEVLRCSNLNKIQIKGWNWNFLNKLSSKLALFLLFNHYLSPLNLNCSALETTRCQNVSPPPNSIDMTPPKQPKKYHFCVIYQKKKQSRRNLLWMLSSQQTARLDRHRKTEEKLFFLFFPVHRVKVREERKRKIFSFRTQAKCPQKKWTKIWGDYFEFVKWFAGGKHRNIYFFSVPNSNAVKTGEVFSGLRKLFCRQHSRLLNQAQGSI